MKKILLLLSVFSFSGVFAQQSPCITNPVYRQFDFWLGEWEVYNVRGNKAGDSKISLILDSCIILEEWTSTRTQYGIVYKGKSFNKYNAVSGQWQQTWVDNAGGSIEFLEGKSENNTIQFQTKAFAFSKDTMAIRKLTFFNLDKDKVRQFGEISKDNTATWTSEYDLEYRRKKVNLSD